MAKKKYTLTPEHHARLPEWRDGWIANAMSTAAMTEEDRERCRDAVRRLYEAANLKAPPPHRIVFVPSPFVATFAGGFAAWVWHQRKAGHTMAVGRVVGKLGAAAGEHASHIHPHVVPGTTYDVLYGTDIPVVHAVDTIAGATAEALTEAGNVSPGLPPVRALKMMEKRSQIATRARSEAAIDFATRSAVVPATWTETSDATWSATADATTDAVEEAVFADATGDAVREATKTPETALFNAATAVPARATLDSVEAQSDHEIYRGAGLAVDRVGFTISLVTDAAVADATKGHAESTTRGTAMDANDAVPSATTPELRLAARQTLFRPVTAATAPWSEATLRAVQEAVSVAVVYKAPDSGPERAMRRAAMVATYDLPPLFPMDERQAVAQTVLRPVATVMDPWSDATRQAVQEATSEAAFRAPVAAQKAMILDPLARAETLRMRLAAHAATGAATGHATWVAVSEATDVPAPDDAVRQATNNTTRDTTNSATWQATGGETLGAVAGKTWDATWGALGGVTQAQTEGATLFATEDARDAATRASPSAPAPDLSRWWVAPNVHEMAALCGVGTPGVQCARAARNMWQGGNQWSGYAAYLSFFRHVAQLPIDYTAWDAWETLARLSGPRIVHEDFCIISDRPELLTVDDEHRPHAEHGPFCRWRDGTALYSWHGVRVPAKWIEDRSTLTAADALSEENLEVRRAACEIIGWDRILSDLNAKTIDRDADPQIGELVEVDLPDSGRERFLRVVCGTGRRFAIPVPPTVQTALEANAWTYGLEPHEYNPEFRT